MATHSSILAWEIPGQRSLAGYTVHGVAKSQARLKQLSMRARSFRGAHLPQDGAQDGDNALHCFQSIPDFCHGSSPKSTAAP